MPHLHWDQYIWSIPPSGKISFCPLCPLFPTLPSLPPAPSRPFLPRPLPSHPPFYLRALPPPRPPFSAAPSRPFLPRPLPSLPSTFREGDREGGYRPRIYYRIYVYMWYIYNRPIGHYLDMHMKTAGQNDIPGKIYIQLNVQLYRGPRPKCLSSRFTTFHGACGVSHQGIWYAHVTSFGVGLTAVIAERWRNTW